MLLDEFDQAEKQARNLQNGLLQIKDLLGQAGHAPGGAGIGGFDPIIGYLLVLLVGAALASRLFGTGPALALREFLLNPDAPGPSGEIIRFAGRFQGFFSWLLTILGFNPITKLVVTRQQIRLESQSAFGSRRQVIPLPHASSIAVGNSRPIPFLILAIGLLFLGITRLTSLTGLLLLLAGLATGVYYYFRKQFFIEIRSDACRLGMSLTSNLLEGVIIDFEQLRRASLVLEEAIRQATMITPMNASPSDSVFVREPVIRVTQSPASGIPVEDHWVDEDRESINPAMQKNRPSEESALPPIPLARPITQPEGIPVDQISPLPRKEKRPKVRPSKEDLVPTNLADEARAMEAFEAAARVFESGRAIEAEAAWRAIIARWPTSGPAMRARNILRNRRRANRQKPN